MTAPAFTLVFPGDPATATGGFIYDRRIRDGLIADGADVGTLVLEGPFPSRDMDVAARSIAAMRTVEAGRPLVVDGLALGGLGEAVAALSGTSPLIGLVHHPLALETGLAADEAQRLADSERHALSHCCGVIATSETTRETLMDAFGVDPERCIAVPPGLDPFTHSKEKTEPRTALRLLSVGTLIPRKGYAGLVDALSQLKHLPWRLDIVGDDTLDPLHARAIRTRIAEAGLAARVTIHGKHPREVLRRFYAEADAFVLAAHYEGYGMAFAEAVAAGLPVIGTTGGAIPRTVPEGCGILVPPGDVDALKAALETMITSPQQRAGMAATARVAAAQFPDWPDRAAAFADAVAGFAAQWRKAH